MSHISFCEPGHSLELEVDYVVVGSGAGGAAAAVTLARGGAEVAIVEAGPWRDPEDYPSSTYGTMRDLFDDWGSQIVRGRALWPIVQARCVGGTTVINSAICVRTPADLFEQWERERGLDTRAMRERVAGHQDTLERELAVSVVPASARGRSNELAMLGAERAGFDSHWIQRYVEDCEGAGQCLQGCKKRRKRSTNLNFVPEVLERGGHVLSCAPVERVSLQDGPRGRRAVGVEGRFRHPDERRDGAPFFVRARRGVFVAASVTHSPCILMRSGVKLAALGHEFRAHPGTGVFGIYDEPVDMNVGATQGWASTAFREEPGLKLETLSIPLEMVASRLSGGGRQLMERLAEYRHMCMWVHAVRAESVGRIKNGFGGKPAISYTLNRDDMLRFREGLYLVAKMHVEAGARRLVPGVFGMPYTIEPDQIEMLREGPLDPRPYLAILSHLFGGCIMGTDERRSVTDGSGRVHGHEGLVVCDASVIPSNLGVNPQHTIMALAMSFAEDALERDFGGRAADARATSRAAIAT